MWRQTERLVAPEYNKKAALNCAACLINLHQLTETVSVDWQMI